MKNNETDPIVSTLRVMNTAAVKAHALKCSILTRANKFTRVGEPFLNEVQADLEAFIRRISNENIPTQPVVEPDECAHFVSGQAMDKLRTAVDNWLARLIQCKVARHPSVGCTLQNTR